MTEEVVKFLGGTAIVIAAIGWFVRSLIGHFLSKDVESFKQRLQSESTVELERLRHSLRLIVSEHEKQIHLLHERRAEVIAELYARLKEFVGAAASFASLVEWKGEPTKEEKAAKLADKAYEFHHYFQAKRIFFSEDVCAKVDTVFQEVHAASMKYRVWLAHSKDGGGRAYEKMDEAWTEAWDTMKDKVPPLVAAVEAEFRSLLGVSKVETSSNQRFQRTVLALRARPAAEGEKGKGDRFIFPGGRCRLSS
jgi:hypothetical protein